MLVEAAWVAAKTPGPPARLLPARPRAPRSPSRGGRRRPQARRPRVAPAHQGTGLHLGAPVAHGAETARPRTPRWVTGPPRTPRRSPRLQPQRGPGARASPEYASRVRLSAAWSLRSSAAVLSEGSWYCPGRAERLVGRPPARQVRGPVAVLKKEADCVVSALSHLAVDGERAVARQLPIAPA